MTQALGDSDDEDLTVFEASPQPGVHQDPFFDHAKVYDIPGSASPNHAGDIFQSQNPAAYGQGTSANPYGTATDSTGFRPQFRQRDTYNNFDPY